jgi:hypothetical protein
MQQLLKNDKLYFHIYIYLLYIHVGDHKKKCYWLYDTLNFSVKKMTISKSRINEIQFKAITLHNMPVLSLPFLPQIVKNFTNISLTLFFSDYYFNFYYD